MYTDNVHESTPLVKLRVRCRWELNLLLHDQFRLCLDFTVTFSLWVSPLFLKLS